MKLSRHLNVPEWGESQAKLAEEYWRSRGFSEFFLSEGPTLKGRRSSVFASLWPYTLTGEGGDFPSIDWRKLRGRLIMAPGELGGVQVELGFLAVAMWEFSHRFTEWGPAFLRLEMAELEHVLWGEGGLEETWNRFHQDERPASFLWLFSSGFAGRRLSEEWEQQLSSLEERFLLAGDLARGFDD